MPTTQDLSRFAGWSCLAIGAYHATLGVRSVPGATAANATVDSRERFYAVLFAWYGAEWLRTAERSAPGPDAERLAAVMAAAGVARVVSVVDKGSPHWFQNVLTAVEFGFPATVFAATRRR